jgi:hypothetical protein
MTGGWLRFTLAVGSFCTSLSLAIGTGLGYPPTAWAAGIWAAVVVGWTFSWYRLARRYDQLADWHQQLVDVVTRREPWRPGGHRRPDPPLGPGDVVMTEWPPADLCHCPDGSGRIVPHVHVPPREPVRPSVVIFHGPPCPGHVPGQVPTRARCEAATAAASEVKLRPDGTVTFL